MLATTSDNREAAFRHCLSVDVEEHFMVEAFADRITRDNWSKFPSRVVANTRRVLDLFARYGVRGTFFIVGWTAERNPGLVRDIVAAGHEIGCHSHLHRAIWNLSPEQFREDLKQAIAAIENVAGVKVQGFSNCDFPVAASSRQTVRTPDDHNQAIRPQSAGWRRRIPAPSTALVQPCRVAQR